MSMEDAHPENLGVAKTDDNESNNAIEILTGRESNCDDGSFPCLENKSTMETSRNLKRKRIHMDSSACNELVASGSGSKSLTCPQGQPRNNVDVNRGLHPVIRSRRRKINDGTDVELIGSIDQNHLSNRQTLSLSYCDPNSGFISASQVYQTDVKSGSQPSPWKRENSNDGFPKSQPVKSSKSKKQIPNQGSILNFMSKSVSSPAHSSTSSISATPPGPSPQKDSNDSGEFRCVMYSPIKKVTSSDSKSVIYISDSSNSPLSQKSTQSEKASSVSDNAVVKKLFEASKNFDPRAKTKRKVTKEKTNFLQKPELNKIKKEAAMYFENDSFDMNSAFDSDMEDSSQVVGSQINNENKKKDVPDKYGLLGSGSFPKEEKVNYFERLPPEVLENIFCQLPMLDLCLNCNRVCQQWNNIIADDKFVPWKKWYHKLKADVDRDSNRQRISNIMHLNEMSLATHYLSGLIRYMKNFKPVTAANMLQCLQKHSKYQWASDLIHERLQDCIKNEEPNPWSVIATLVILSETVYEIQEIIDCLSVSSSQCTSKEIIECLYCIASLLYCFQRGPAKDVWNGMHYRLFYALYLYENSSTTSCSDLQSISDTKTGQQSLVKYSSGNNNVKLTHEQLRIVKHLAGPHEVIKIVAFAGTGKTTTLVRYTQLRPNKKFLLVVYNKSVSDHAKTKFPNNVECRTGHSLAFQAVGRKYAHKLFNLKVYALTQALQARKGMNLFLQAKFVMTTLENFFASDDDNIETHHVPDSRFNEKTGTKEFIDPSTKSLYVADAKLIWRRMKDYNDKKIGMSHDGYLKLYQLSKPRLTKYDCILIDEAQDITPAITDILLQQRQGKILVGDPHQQIYSFRGAINAMDRIRADTLFYLTQSFRFGPEIAQVAMSCLEVLKREKKKTLVGSAKKSTIDGTKIGQLAIISRSNLTVFNEAVKKCCYSNEQCKVAFVGGTTNFGFPMLMDIYALSLSESEREKENLAINNKFIKMFKTFADLDNFATKAMDNELLGKIKIVKAYNHTLPLHIRKIESKCVRDERFADYVFSTAHKAKGLEFSTVRVTDDFLGDQTGNVMVRLDVPQYDVNHVQPLQDTVHVAGTQEADEENLLYVAVTRAQNALQMSPTLMRVIQRAGERFSYPVYSKNLQTSERTFKCLHTASEFKPYCLTLEKKEIQLGGGQKIAGGLYSPAYLSETSHSFSQLLGSLDVENKNNEDKEIPAKLPENFYPRGFDADQ